MYNDKLSLREWIKAYQTEKLASVTIMSWYDWFCRYSQLDDKTVEIATILTSLKDGGKLDLDDLHVWLTNNECYAYYYDAIHLTSKTNDNNEYCIELIPETSENKQEYVVNGNTNDNEYGWGTLFKTTSKQELIDWLNN